MLIRKVVSFVGQVISMSYVIGNIVHIIIKCLSSDFLSAVSWNHDIFFNDDSRRQIYFWKIMLIKPMTKFFVMIIHVKPLFSVMHVVLGTGVILLNIPWVLRMVCGPKRKECKVLHGENSLLFPEFCHLLCHLCIVNVSNSFLVTKMLLVLQKKAVWNQMYRK